MEGPAGKAPHGLSLIGAAQLLGFWGHCPLRCLPAPDAQHAGNIQAPACPPVQVAVTCLTPSPGRSRRWAHVPWEKGSRPVPSPTKDFCVLHLPLSCRAHYLAQPWRARVASPSPLPFPTSSPPGSPVFSLSSHKNVSAGPGLLSHPIVNNTAPPLPTGQAQACPRGQPSPPAGVHIHLFTFGSPPRMEQSCT